MALLTIFTPTYNRQDKIKMAYESLLRQTDKDFLWLIVDDGSRDGTREQVESWIEDGRISIRYIWQENSGKPSATNLSIDLCESDLWICLDSDDYLTDRAVELIRREYEVIKNNETCCGIVGNRFHYTTGEVVGIDGKSKECNHMPKDVSFVSYEELVYRRHVKADKAFVYKTSVLKGYRYPIFPGEKFIGESYLYERIGTDYCYYISHEKLYLCEYLDNGLTANYLKLHIASPRGYKLLKEQMMQYPKPYLDKFKGAIMYVAGCKLCGDRHIIRNSPRKTMTLLAYPFGWLAYYKKYWPIIKNATEG